MNHGFRLGWLNTRINSLDGPTWHQVSREGLSRPCQS